jgi:hypothetical protein
VVHRVVSKARRDSKVHKVDSMARKVDYKVEIRAVEAAPVQVTLNAVARVECNPGVFASLDDILSLACARLNNLKKLL